MPIPTSGMLVSVAIDCLCGSTSAVALFKWFYVQFLTCVCASAVVVSLCDLFSALDSWLHNWCGFVYVVLRSALDICLRICCGLLK